MKPLLRRQKRDVHGREIQDKAIVMDDFDLIDAHYFYPDGVAAVMLGKALRKPVGPRDAIVALRVNGCSDGGKRCATRRSIRMP